MLVPLLCVIGLLMVVPISQAQAENSANIADSPIVIVAVDEDVGAHTIVENEEFFERIGATMAQEEAANCVNHPRRTSTAQWPPGQFNAARVNGTDDTCRARTGGAWLRHSFIRTA